MVERYRAHSNATAIRATVVTVTYRWRMAHEHASAPKTFAQ